MQLFSRFKRHAPRASGATPMPPPPETTARWHDYLDESVAYSQYLASRDGTSPTLTFAEFINGLDRVRTRDDRRQEAG